ncbi:MAG: hypothetical protein P8Y70_00380 [Candidatus Lokiarchaeota archaeon]
MSFAEIEELIQKNLINGTYPLRNDGINLSLLFGKEIPIFTNLVIKNVSIESEPSKSIIVDGTGDIINFEDLDIELGFEYGGKDDNLKDVITYSLQVLLPPNEKGNLLYSFAEHIIENIPIPDQIPLPQIEFSDFTISISPAKEKVVYTVKARTGWEIPIGFNSLKLSEIEISLSKSKEKGEVKYSGSFGGKLEIGGFIFAVKSKIPDKFELKTIIPSFNLSSLLQGLCGPTVIQNSGIPSDLLELEIRNLSFAIIINKGLFQFRISGESDFGKTEFYIKEVEEDSTTDQPSESSSNAPKKKTWAFAVGFSPPETFQFSDINSLLSVLNDLKLTNIILILSSGKFESRNFPTLDIGDLVKIKKGVNLFVSLDLTGMDIIKLIGIEKLALRGQIGLDPFNLLLAASIDTEINIANIINIKNINFEIEVPDLSLTLRNQMELKLEKDLLLLTLAAKFLLKETIINLAGTMEGVWKDPFGFKGVTIEDVALQLGINFLTTPIPLPVIGLAGTLKVGDFFGSGAIKINPSNPMQCMLKIQFNKILLVDVIQLFCDPTLIIKFPPGFLEILYGIGFEKVNLYLVPTTVYIGDLKYDPGFYIQGFMHFLDWYGLIDLRLDWERGFKMYGKLDPIEIPGVLSIKGLDETPNPIVNTSLYEGESPHFYIFGSLEVLGIKSNTGISIDENGFKFGMTGKLFNFLDATLLVEGADIRKSEVFRIKAVIHNDILNKIIDGLINAIELFANGTNDQISVLLNEINKAQAVVNDWDRQIADMTEQIEGERAIVLEELKKAQRILNSAQSDLNDKQELEDEMRELIQAERDKLSAGLVNLINDVNNAQNAYDSLKNRINSKYDDIEDLEDDIDDLEDDRDDCFILDAACIISKEAAILIKEGQITALYAEIGVLLVAKETAKLVLDAAEEALEAAQNLIDNTPIELDPRMIPLIAAREAAKLAVDIAIKAVAAVEEMIEDFPIESDPRILTLIAAKEIAQKVLKAAEEALEAFQAGVNTLLNSALDIIKEGFDNVFNIRAISFEAKLNIVSGGLIPLIMDVMFRGESHKIMFQFDLNDIEGSFARLGHQIISGQLEYAEEKEMIKLDDIVFEIPISGAPPTGELPPTETMPPTGELPPTETAPPIVEKPIEDHIRIGAYYIYLKNYSYNDLCWMLAEKILNYTNQPVSKEDIKKKAEQIFKSSFKYEELCWFNARMELLIISEFLEKVIEKPPEDYIRMGAYYLYLKNFSYNDLCWFLAEKVLNFHNQPASKEDTEKKAKQIFQNSRRYDELCWFNAEMELQM